MRTILLIILFGITSVNAQITIFEDGFESYPDFTITNFGDWTMHDVDATLTWGVAETDFPNEDSAMAGIIFNPYTCSTDVSSFDNYSPHSGNKYVTFWASLGNDSVVSDNYLITPKIDLRNVTNPILTFFAKSLASDASPSISPEEFELFISTTGNAIDDFTFNLGGVEYVQRQGNGWDDFTHDLTPYIGEEIYIAIHHISPSSSYALHFDDFKIEVTTVANITDSKIVNYTYYPNPVGNVLNIKTDSDLIKTVTVLNTLGQIVLTKKGNNLETEINTTNLKNGVYFATIEGENKKTTFSFIKK